MTLKERQITNSRLVDAPREQVWDAWTDARKVATWWGPDGFQNLVEEMDVRPGGVFRLMMVGPDGTRYPNLLVYQVVERPSRITWVHSSGEAGETDAFESEVTFEAEGARTRITLTATFKTQAARDFVVKNVNAEEGGRQTLGRFAAALDEDRGADLVLTRMLRAPRAKVWDAWTDPVQLGQWWGPKGYTIGVARFDLVPGGLFVYSMEAPAGNAGKMWGRFAFREVSPIDRLAWINSFSDPDGGVTRAPFAPTFPAEIHNLLTLEDVEGGTLLTLRGRPINTSAEDQATFDGMRPSMNVGWGGTFEQLEAFLAR